MSEEHTPSAPRRVSSRIPGFGSRSGGLDSPMASSSSALRRSSHSSHSGSSTPLNSSIEKWAPQQLGNAANGNDIAPKPSDTAKPSQRLPTLMRNQTSLSTPNKNTSIPIPSQTSAEVNNEDLSQPQSTSLRQRVNTPAVNLTIPSPTAMLTSPLLSSGTQEQQWDQKSPAIDITTSQDPASGGKSNILVAVRLRPLSAKESNRGDHVAWGIDEQQNVGQWKDGAFVPRFHYDNVFGPQANNRDVFKVIAQPLVAPALQGYSGTVFAYGVTSSGKTHTMMGSLEPGGERGIVPLTVQELFNLVDSQHQAAQQNQDPDTWVSTYTVKLQMMEIYNEVLNDLLDPTRANLKLREDGQRGVVVDQLHEEIVTSAEEALAGITRGDTNRKVGATAYNDDSSRSHTICRLVVEGYHRLPGAVSDAAKPPTPLSPPPSAKKSGGGASKKLDGTRTTHAIISLIDLAGSESAKVTITKGQRLEGSYINKSLLTLGTVINKLAAASAVNGNKAQVHIPFRDSKLTRLLQGSLTGAGARIAFVCNITPAAAQTEETANTLKFATRAKLIRVSVSAHASSDERALLRQYRQEVRELRAQLAAALMQQQQAAIQFKSRPADGEGDEDGDNATSSEEARLREHCAQLMKELEIERAARLKAERECESLESRLFGLSRLLAPGTEPKPVPGNNKGMNKNLRASDSSLEGSISEAKSSGIPRFSSNGTAVTRPVDAASPTPSFIGMAPPTPVSGTHPSRRPSQHGNAGADVLVVDKQKGTGIPRSPISFQLENVNAEGSSPVARFSSPDSLDSSVVGSPTDVDAELLLLEQINQLQDELANQAKQQANAAKMHASSGGGFGAYNYHQQNYRRRLSTTPSSIMGDADKDLEIQVLLADREVLQDQVVNVELQNEALLSQNNALAAQLQRQKELQLKYESEHEALRNEVIRLQSLLYQGAVQATNSSLNLSSHDNNIMNNHSLIPGMTQPLMLNTGPPLNSGMFATGAAGMPAGLLMSPPASAMPNQFGLDPTVWMSAGNLGAGIYEAAGFANAQQQQLLNNHGM